MTLWETSLWVTKYKNYRIKEKKQQKKQEKEEIQPFWWFVVMSVECQSKVEDHHNHTQNNKDGVWHVILASWFIHPIYTLFDKIAACGVYCHILIQDTLALIHGFYFVAEPLRITFLRVFILRSWTLRMYVTLQLRVEANIGGGASEVSWVGARLAVWSSLRTWGLATVRVLILSFILPFLPSWS